MGKKYNRVDLISKLKLITWLLAIITFSGLNTHAQQDNPISLEIVVLPPYSTQLMDYFSSPTQAAITIINPTLTTYNVFFAGSITNISTDQGVTIRNDVPPSAPPLVISPGIRILTGADLEPFVNPSALQYTGISDQEIANGNLPEGDYQICLQLYDYNTLALRSQPEPLGCSNIFTIQFVQPPILISPTCSTEVNYSMPQNIVFTWVPPPAVINPALLSYEFKLVEVPQGMNAVDAMNSSAIPVLTFNTIFPVFLYSSLNPPLISGRQYAWRVTVSDVSNTILFSNNGQSEICEFRYGFPDPGTLPITSSIVYPRPGTRIPFRRVPLVARYDPFNPEYRGMIATTEVKENGEGFDLIEYVKNWPSGPEIDMLTQLNVPPTINQIQHLQVGRNLSTFPGAAELRSGRNYDVTTTITLDLANGSTSMTSSTGSFSQGFDKPVLKMPPQDTAFMRNVVNFSFKTTEPLPVPPNFMDIIPDKELLRSLTGTNSNFFNAEVRERFRLEVARDLAFDSIVTVHSELFTYSESITKDSNVDQLKSQIFKDLSKELYVPDTGAFFWRVHWLVDPFDSLSTPYATSDIFRFKILAPIAADTIRAACMADCDAPFIEDRNPVSTILQDQMVKVGQFEMLVSSINYFGPLATGRGLISVPFLNTTVKVLFNEVSFNAAGELISGAVVADYDTIGFMPNIPGLGKLTVNNREELIDYVRNRQGGELFDPSIPMGLPLGLDKELEGERYMIAIVGMRFDSRRASLSAAVSFPLPFLPVRTSDGKMQQLGLGASDICFHPNGLAGAGVGALYLADPLEFDYAPGQYFQLKSSMIDELTGSVADSGTYVSWDCEGFRALHLEGEISFSRDVLKRATKKGVKSLKDVKARFSFNVRRSGNWLAALDFDPFVVAGLEDWNFVVQEATLDFSDLSNPDNMVFPQNYVGDRSVLWNGFHLKSLKVGLPEEFKIRFQEQEIDETGKDSVLKNRVVVSLNDLLIDRTGISGKLEALRLIELENGVLGDWAFSLDTLNFEVMSNSFVRGGFTGEIRTPLTPTLFKYNSVLSQSADTAIGLSYQFNVLPKDTITVPLWAAKMNILPTSRITISVDTAGFKPELLLNGSIDIMQKVGEIPIRFAGVTFTELRLNNVAPYLTCTNFVFASPQKEMSGFPVSVTNLRLTSQEYHGLFSWDDTPGPRMALEFTLTVNFMGETNAFGGSTTLAILGRFDPGNLMDLVGGGGDEIVYPSLVLSGIDLKTINLQADMGFVKMKGFINFFAEDPVYGQGFMGGIEATFIESIKVQVIGAFGEINSLRYWYVDAMVRFSPGIPLGVAPYQLPVDLYGFGGGAYYHMQQQGALPPASEMNTASTDGTPTVGTTLSNIRLVPSSTTLFGLKATVVLGNTGGGTAFNCDVTLAIDFNTDGGINTISFDGSGYFMTQVLDRTFTAVRADVLISYNMPANILTGNFTVTVNVPLTMEGTLPIKVAGRAYLYIGPDYWQLLAGEPTPDEARMGLRMASSFETKGYLMAGMRLPAPPPVPSNVTAILTSLPPTRNAEALEGGTGFAFGAAFTPPRIEGKYLAFNAKLDASVGFDLNLFDYGATRCDGMNPGERLGVNGWYSNGRIWGYFDGAIGLEVDIWGERVNYQILEIQAAAILEAGFPNPAWMVGMVGGNYSILNGLYSGNCQYEIKIGNSCEPPAESPLASVKMIADLSPAANSNNVDCGLTPNAVFNIDVNKAFAIPVNNSDGTTTTRHFRFRIESFTLRRGSTAINEVSISTKLDGSQAILVPTQFLRDFAQHTVSITVVAEERINGVYQVARRNNNTEIREQLSKTFTTGPLPDKITDGNVAYSYPLRHQRFFARGQCQKGIINLKQDMAFIFNSAPRAGFSRTYHAIFERNSGGGSPLETTVTYSSSARQIQFDIPDINQNTIYKVRIIHRDIRTQSNTQQSGGLLAGVQGVAFQGINSQINSVLGQNLMMRTRSLGSNSALRENEHLIYEYYFRTGSHLTVNDKVNALTVSNVQRDFDGIYENFVITFQGGEELERYEVDGFPYMIGFDQFTFRYLNMKDNFTANWHTNYLRPRIYDLYSRIVSNNYSSHRFSRSSPDAIGIPPDRIGRTSTGTRGPLTSAEINPSAENSSTGSFPILSGPNLAIVNLNPTSNLVFQTSYYARMDWSRMNTMIAQIKTRFGNNMTLTYGGRKLDSTTKSMINTFTNSPNYQNMYNNSSYGIRFTSSSPVGCSPNAGNLNVVKSFNYGFVMMMMNFTTF